MDIKAKIRNWLGVETDPFEQEMKLAQLQELKAEVMEVAQLARQDVKALYEELSQDFNRLKREVRNIKPVLKVEDPEAEKFIRGVLSKHDNLMRTQQTAIEEKMLLLRNIETSIDTKMSFYRLQTKEVNDKFDTIVKHLEKIQTDTAPKAS